jgi:hypothetical protein
MLHTLRSTGALESGVQLVKALSGSPPGSLLQGLLQHMQQQGLKVSCSLAAPLSAGSLSCK